jgi:hypothetical protein
VLNWVVDKLGPAILLLLLLFFQLAQVLAELAGFIEGIEMLHGKNVAEGIGEIDLESA